MMTKTFKLLAIGLMLLPFSVSSVYAVVLVGPRGGIGPTGATGLKGATGATGATGAAGSKGDLGATGAAGPKGDMGATGAAGKDAPASPGPVYILGDIGPSGTGNVVFYVDGSGQHGLEAKTTDAAGGALMIWATAMTTAQAYGTCLTPVLKTPTCWHLPTKSELALLWEQKNVVGGFAKDYYWSSTEIDHANAWDQAFGNGLQYSGYKPTTFPARAVRAF